MNDNLSDQQFAKYSAIKVDHPFHEYEYAPLPASMERHAPGEYQPTLPGMEKMLKGEQTHTSVFFKHPNAIVKDMDSDWGGDVPGSDWHGKTVNYLGAEVSARASSLRPTQDWMDDNHLHSPVHENTLRNQGTRPKVEFVRRQNIIQDGHHRAVREILNGKQMIDIERWGREADYK
jgi:hypothetical protein